MTIARHTTVRVAMCSSRRHALNIFVIIVFIVIIAVSLPSINCLVIFQKLSGAFSKFIISEELSAVNNFDRFDRQVVCTCWVSLHFLDKVPSRNDSSVNCMLLVQVRSRPEANEELRQIGVEARVSHRKNTLVSVRVPYLLILKFLAVDTLSTGFILICGVSILSHETLDNSMENDIFVVEWRALVSNTD